MGDSHKPHSVDLAQLRAWRHGDLPVARVLLAAAADEIEELRAALGKPIRATYEVSEPRPTEVVNRG
jgi:hypothetical protein